ncbi:hypothetical protein AC622_01650 [Bacillus sp. FJAT-27916]|uniref:sensor histidine kinase n=1 Tax=Bacillaceae TaxID=186817 RepID=UPI00067144B1|nr:HAMP domain-containing sensor histidine kinase [Bacillus sp. FJAT-27916]KMY43116.1 hypothetical protein AC622_01650 [Bacillus sp. FJAT-27916]
MKLQTRINLLSTVLTLFIFIISFTGIYYLYKYLAYDTEYHRLQMEGDEILAAISELDGTANIDTLLRSYIPQNGMIYITDEDNQALLRLQATSTADKMDYALKEGEKYTVSEWEGELVMAIRYPMIWPDQSVVNVHLVQPLQEVSANMTILKWILILITLLAIIPIYLASQLLVRLIVLPIQRLTSTMRRNISDSRYDKLELPDNKKGEIAEMTYTYNSLMDKLEDSYNKQQQFVGNASHELKTPLTIIESYAKLLQRRGFKNEDINREALEAITSQTGQMKVMIEQMLELAKANETLQLKWESVTTTALLTEIIDSFQKAYKREVTLHGEEFSFSTDVSKLRQMMFILLDNARKYSEGKIDVFVEKGNDITIQVRDYGPGIKEEDIPHIFDRFYRVNKDRNRQTGGTGLGLAIAKDFAGLLGGTITVESVLGEGTSFIITLPKEVEKHD